MKLLAAIGSWDGVHIGHRALLARLVTEASRLALRPAAVTFDPHPLAVVRPDKAPGLLCSLDERVRRLRCAGAAEVIVLPFTEELRRHSAADFMAMLHRDYAVDAIMLGFNNTFGSDRLAGAAAYRSVGREVGVTLLDAPELTDAAGGAVSSSTIRRLVREGEVERASRLLAAHPELTGTVEHGNRLGRTIGFPTANVRPEGHPAIPARGAYAAIAVTDSGDTYPAMVNIGLRPTVDLSDHPRETVEAHLIGYTGDLYGQRLTLRFVKRLRPETRFDSPEELARQLARDREATLRALA